MTSADDDGALGPGNAPRHVRPIEVEPVMFREHEFRFLIEGHESGGTYAAMHITSPAETGPNPHTHPDAEEAFYVLDGNVTFSVDGATVEARAGDWIHIPRGVTHSFRTGATGTTYLAIYAPGGEEQGFRE